MTRDEVVALLPQYLKDHNMTQQQFAEKIGVSRVIISNWIHGARKPSYEKYERLVELMEDERHEILE
jgi:transcriptional regulator with XRE-family HTH domain